MTLSLREKICNLFSVSQESIELEKSCKSCIVLLSSYEREIVEEILRDSLFWMRLFSNITSIQFRHTSLKEMNLSEYVEIYNLLRLAGYKDCLQEITLFIKEKLLKLLPGLGESEEGKLNEIANEFIQFLPSLNSSSNILLIHIAYKHGIILPEITESVLYTYLLTPILSVLRQVFLSSEYFARQSDSIADCFFLIMALNHTIVEWKRICLIKEYHTMRCNSLCRELIPYNNTIKYRNKLFCSEKCLLLYQNIEKYQGHH